MWKGGWFMMIHSWLLTFLQTRYMFKFLPYVSYHPHIMCFTCREVDGGDVAAQQDGCRANDHCLRWCFFVSMIPLVVFNEMSEHFPHVSMVSEWYLDSIAEETRGKRDEKEGDDMQQRATGWNQTHSLCTSGWTLEQLSTPDTGILSS